MLKLIFWIAVLGIAAAYLLPYFAPTGSTNTYPSSNAISSSKELYVNATNLNVRSCPSTNCEAVSSISRGAKVLVVEKSDQWSRIQSPVNGWISSSFLEESPSTFEKVNQVSDSSTPATSTTATSSLEATLDRTVEQKPDSKPDLWVVDDRAPRHTCPNKRCGVVGLQYFREGVFVKEKKRRWARVTKYYDAACVNGSSEYVDSGTRKCTRRNGIKDGKFAEWIELKHLSNFRPDNPAEDAVGMAKVIAGSDDFRLYESAFVEAAEKMIREGKCRESDFLEWGGWTKSVNNHKSEPVYFTYCEPGPTRYYLNVGNGAIYR